MSAAGPLLDSSSAASLHCRVHPETYRSAWEQTRSAEHVEMPGKMVPLDELRGGRS
jgi:hypothetical protein